MYKNQLQELAQRSCFNLPSYACIREGPDHAPRFKATVNFNGEVFESPNYCSTLRQAEHSAAEVALNALATRGPARSLAARVLDETGVYKNLLQEVTHRAGLSLPMYTTVRSGPGHLPVFTCTVDLAGISFTGEPAKTKKQAEKNAAMAAWSALKQLAHLGSSSSSPWDADEDQEREQEQITIARALSNLRGRDDAGCMSHQQLLQRRRIQAQRDKHSLVTVKSPRYHSQPTQQQHNRVLTLPTLPPPPPAPAPTGSKLLPFIRSIFPQRSQQPQQHESIQSPSSSLSPLPRDSFNRATPNLGSFHDMHTYPKAENRPTSRVLPVQSRTRLGASIQEVPIPLEEHQRDEDEWLHGGDTSTRGDSKNTAGAASSWSWGSAANAFAAFGSNNNTSRSSYSMQQPPQNFNFPSTHQSCTVYGNPSSSSSRCLRPVSSLDISPVTIRSTVPVCAAPPPRRIISDSNRNGSNFAAPGIRIRSVIPVCSAPPVPPGFPSPGDREAVESSHRAQAAKGVDEDEGKSDGDADKLMQELNMKLQL
ncbi:double-stranded RNA-binding protein 5 [Cryptomeria japonica]|uniref:double-stranded RNA-binding protein 5 n=1 Tax=Cryptomeria japonica TaxID=3369 RepID=UPI0027DAB522|nr:double-stranded RNA-binding protein 5 [Cryptomeria japonica]